MRAVIVQNQVNSKRFGDILTDSVEKFAELDAAVPPMALANHGPGLYIEHREQGSGAMPFIVVTAAFGLPSAHRQHRLGPIQSLDLRFLLYTQNHGPIRRIEIQAHNIPDLIDE